MNRGPAYETEFFSYSFAPGANTAKEPDDRVFTSLTNILIGLVARGPLGPRVASDQQMREIQSRLREGEPKDRVARAYGIEVEHVDLIRQRARVPHAALTPATGKPSRPRAGRL